MTGLLLWAIMVMAAAVLVGVLASIVRALRAESASARLRRDGVRATGTVICLWMSPVVDVFSAHPST